MDRGERPAGAFPWRRTSGIVSLPEFTFREDFMRRYIHGVALFAAGMIAALFFMRPSQAQDDRLSGIRLNHVGISAKDWDQTLNFYTKTLGFKEAFTFKDKDGNVTTSYIQM